MYVDALTQFTQQPLRFLASIRLSLQFEEQSTLEVAQTELSLSRSGPIEGEYVNPHVTPLASIEQRFTMYSAEMKSD